MISAPFVALTNCDAMRLLEILRVSSLAAGLAATAASPDGIGEQVCTRELHRRGYAQAAAPDTTQVKQFSYGSDHLAPRCKSKCCDCKLSTLRIDSFDSKDPLPFHGRDIDE